MTRKANRSWRRVLISICSPISRKFVFETVALSGQSRLFGNGHLKDQFAEFSDGLGGPNRQGFSTFGIDQGKGIAIRRCADFRSDGIVTQEHLPLKRIILRQFSRSGNDADDSCTSLLGRGRGGQLKRGKDAAVWEIQESSPNVSWMDLPNPWLIGPEQ